MRTCTCRRRRSFGWMGCGRSRIMGTRRAGGVRRIYQKPKTPQPKRNGEAADNTRRRPRERPTRATEKKVTRFLSLHKLTLAPHLRPLPPLITRPTHSFYNRPIMRLARRVPSLPSYASTDELGKSGLPVLGSNLATGPCGWSGRPVFTSNRATEPCGCISTPPPGGTTTPTACAGRPV